VQAYLEKKKQAENKAEKEAEKKKPVEPPVGKCVWLWVINS